ncbi:hypothetical protein LCGC14_0859830 [marine sediment metagenome]|uniref:Uncharacterized protein n=1 Tax=marine sediment metagenome TaxID=412755 RepID=A0A0F9SES9_9ZZZZ
MNIERTPSTATEAVTQYMAQEGEGYLSETAPGVITVFLDGGRTQIWPLAEQEVKDDA